MTKFLATEEYTMQMVAGYFDESSDEDTEGACYVVAGFFGNNLATVTLDLRWRELLDRYGIEYFKASELSSGEGQFKKFRDDPQASGWHKFSEREKSLFDEIKTAFTDVMVGVGGIAGVGASLIIPDYRRIIEEYPIAKANLMAPYFLCANVVLMEVGTQMQRVNQKYRGDRRMNLRPVFDSHEEYSGRMKQGFDSFRRKNPITSKYLLAPHYEDDKEYLSLQAADNLAFEIRKLTLSLRDNRPERIAMARLKEDFLFKIYKLDYRSLKVIADAQKPDFNAIEPITYTLEDILKEHEIVFRS